MKTAMVIGFSGQDAQHLTKLLLEKDYRVISTVRRVSTEPPTRYRLDGLLDNKNLSIIRADLTDYKSLADAISKYQPDEIYNIAAQSHVGISFEQPTLTTEVNYVGVINLIQALESEHMGGWKLYQASTSEMFGDKPEGTILDENTTFDPNSPYAIAKAASHFYARSKRANGAFISCGILFNHESKIRGADFVTQKIAKGVNKWRDTGEVIELGNLDAIRDWGHSADYVEAMHLMLQQDKPNEFVIATGEAHTVRDFVNAAFKAIDKEVVWSGSGVEEIGKIDGLIAVKVNPEFYRPNEVPYLKGDASKAKEILGWKPTTSFDDLVKEMVLG